MPLHTSPCRRVLRRHILSSRDSVWISDHLLAAAFERYCRISKACHRNAGHVPGPLESQRRLGKRRMGDTTLQHASSTPSWAFPIPLNLSQWQWEPPKTPFQLQHGVQMGLGARLNQWLQELAYPEFSDPSVLVLDPESTPVAQAKSSLRADLDAYLGFLLAGSLETLPAASRACCHKLQEAIILGHIQPEDILINFTQIWEALDSRYTDKSIGRELYIHLCSAMVSGITESRVLEPALFNAVFWKDVVDRMFELDLDEQLIRLSNQVLIHISRLTFDDQVCGVWVRVMDKIPVSTVPEVCEGVSSMLGAMFTAWSSSTTGNLVSTVPSMFVLNPWAHDHPEQAIDQLQQLVDPKPQTEVQPPLIHSINYVSDNAVAHIRQLRKISRAMQPFASECHGRLLNATTQRVLAEAVSSRDALHNLRYNWLCVLAQMPGVTQDYLLYSISQLAHDQNGVDLLSDADLCTLLLLQWRSRHFLHRQERICVAYDSWRCGTDQDNPLLGLALAIWLGNCGRDDKRHFRSFWKFLKKLGRADRLVDSLETLLRCHKHHQLPLAFLETIAWTSDDHRIAIRVHDSYNSQKERRGFKKQFNPAVFGKYVKSIIRDKSISPAQIWKALDINMYEKRSWDQRNTKNQHHGYHGDRRAEVVRQAIKEFAYASHLSSRVVFRHTYQGIRFLDSHKDGVSVEAAKALYRVIARDLKAGRPGVLERCQWFIHILRRHFGDDIAQRARHALWGWRHDIKQWLYGAQQGLPMLQQGQPLQGHKQDPPPRAKDKRSAIPKPSRKPREGSVGSGCDELDPVSQQMLSGRM